MMLSSQMAIFSWQSVHTSSTYKQEYNRTLAKQKEHHLHKNFVIAWGTNTHHCNGRGNPTMTLSSQSNGHFLSAISTDLMYGPSGSRSYMSHTKKAFPLHGIIDTTL
jgi:hypothetical protein